MTRIVLALWLGAAAIACGSNTPKSSSASNWLLCESDADCAEVGGTCSAEGICVDTNGEPIPASARESTAGDRGTDAGSVDEGSARDAASTSGNAESDASGPTGDEGTSPEEGDPSDPELDAGIESEDETDPVLEGDASSPPEEDSERCALPVAEWLPMAPQAELSALTRSVVWHDGALHYMGDGGSRESFRSNTFEYGRFDPCRNTWERRTFEQSVESRVLAGWDGAGFVFTPLNHSPVLSTRGLSSRASVSSRYSVVDDSLQPVTEPITLENLIMYYPEDAAPEPLPVSAAYMNGATDGSRAFVWGQPAPTDDDPNPAPRGWMLDAGSLVWREIAQQGAPTARRNHAVIAAGGRFVVWGGTTPASNSEYVRDGAFYDPDTDSWETIPSDEAAPGAFSPALSWVADRLVLGFFVYRHGEGWQRAEPLDAPLVNPKRLKTDDGRILVIAASKIHVLDVATVTWLDVPTPAGDPSVENQPNFFDVVWTGSSLLFWGSSVPQSCGEITPELPVCDLIDPFLPAGEGVMVRLE